MPTTEINYASLSTRLGVHVDAIAAAARQAVLSVDAAYVTRLADQTGDLLNTLGAEGLSRNAAYDLRTLIDSLPLYTGPAAVELAMALGALRFDFQVYAGIRIS